ncbi:dihydrodipicolinate reductase [Pseudomonas lactis]|uniref:Dihydrodipicolinate reductase n=1 Tax=Pseudomonas lactis TaxID=1615674 RepID=A0A7Y1M7N5_9PSED|nr:dihydrodipicolinate reductase [Pseudomonas lactis]NNA76492.1 dihydrodipicolinate reductase [Pseudomonas lactis]
MSKKYKVIQWATGSVGRTTLRRIIDHPDLELVGLFTYGNAKVGVDAGTIAKRLPTSVLATNDIEEILRLDADVVIHTSRITDPYTKQNADVERLLASGKNVISINGYYMPAFHGAEYSDALRDAAMRGQATLAGIGVNPGVVAERLALTLSGLMASLEHVECLEVVDCSNVPSADFLLGVLGFNADLEKTDIRKGSLGQLYTDLYSETFAYMAEAWGTSVASIEPDHRMTLALEDIKIQSALIEKGRVAGTEWRWKARFADGRTMTHSLLWTIAPHLHSNAEGAHWKVSARGRPNLEMTLNISDPDPNAPHSRPAMDMTAAVLIRAIPDVCSAESGFYRLPTAQLPFKERF